MEKMGFTSRKKRFHDVPYDSVVSRLDNKENHDAPGSQIRGKGKALSKLISGFAWSRGSTSPSEKSRQQGVTPFVLRDENDDEDDADDAASEDLPMGFPTPPPKLSSTPSRHPAATFGKQHSESAVTHATSLSSISMSSFASTALFEESDSSQSEATSVSVASSSNSSPESSPSRSRMWKVKGLVRDSPQLGSLSSSTHIRRPKASANPRLSLVVEDTEAETRRSSTPVPSCVQMMLAEPETPPRSIRRSSASSQPYPGSPPFDPRAHQKAEAAAVPAPVQPVEPVRPSSSDGSSSAGEADDEVSPPRLKANEELVQQRKRSSGAWGSSASLKAKARIPSLKFEGISMDAMFAEVERKITVTDLTGANGLSGLGIVPSAPLLPVKPNKRTSVMPTPPVPSVLSSKNLPKRSSSIRKPPPLNLSLAPLLLYAGCGPAALSPTSIYSQPSPRSPPLAGAWSATPTPTRPTFAAGSSLPVEKSPSSGLLPSPIRDRAADQRTPSPALSSTSTLRGPASPIPAFSVHPPTPPPHSRRSSLTKPVQRLSPILEPAQEQEQERPAAETTAESMSVKIVPQKRYVKMSSRSGYQRQRRSTTQIMSAPARSPVFAARTAPMAPILEAAPTFSEQDESVSPSAMSEQQQQQQPVRKVALPEILIREPTVPDLVSAHDESMTTPKMDSAPWSPVSPASSLETDMSEEGSDALEHMLHKLEQPHTPPPAERSSTPLATAQAISRGPSPLLAGRDDDNDQLLLELDDVLSGRKRLSSVSCLPTPASSPFLSSGQPETIFEDEDEHAPRSTIDDLCFEDTDIERPLSIAASLDDEQPLHGRTALIEALKASTFESDDEEEEDKGEDKEELDEASMTGLAISSLTFYQDELPTDEEEESTSWSRSESINSLASYDTMTTNASSEHGHAVVVMAERISNAYDPTLVSASNRQLYTASVGIAL